MAAQELNDYGHAKIFTVREDVPGYEGKRSLMRWSQRLGEYVPVYAADHFTRIVDGLRVWDYDMERGAVSLVNLDFHDGWFEVARDNGTRKFMNWERVIPKHPRTDEAA